LTRTFFVLTLFFQGLQKNLKNYIQEIILILLGVLGYTHAQWSESPKKNFCCKFWSFDIFIFLKKKSILFFKLFTMVKMYKKSTKSKVRFSKKTGKHLSKVQKKEVKALIKPLIETKYTGSYTAVNAPVTMYVATPTNCLAFLPICVQGITDFNRIGDDIKPVKATGHWNFYFDSDATNSSVDVMVHLLVLVSKVSPGYQTFSSLPINQFLRVGNGTYTDPTAGDPATMNANINNLPVNSQSWHVLARRTFRMCKNWGQQNADGGIEATNGQTGPSSKRVSITLSKKLKSKLQYLNAADVQPSNFYPTYLVWATCPDGRTIPTGEGGGSVLRYGYRAEMYYKDA